MTTKRNKKEIVALTDFEHVLHRPTIYVGPTDLSDEKVPVIKDGKIISETKTISIGFYKMFNEILDNAFDEAKRMKGKMKTITVDINSKTNEVTVEDSGEGFYKGTDINKKTKITNIETAMSQLRAGSNFYNDDIDEALIGTNGVGAALVNMLSEEFSIETKTRTYTFKRVWKKFKPMRSGSKNATRTNRKTGTSITFIPRKDTFKNAKWDKDIIELLMVMKKYILVHAEPLLKKLKFSVTFDGELLDLDQNVLPEENWSTETGIGHLAIWPHFPDSVSLSFVNSALCSGIHQKIVKDYLNDHLGDPYGHYFYSHLFILNLPPKLVKFGDQNKTKYVTTRAEVEETLMDAFENKLKAFMRTDIFQKIREKVEEKQRDGQIKKIKSLKKKQKVEFSHKYHVASGRKENLFIVEGLSAAGSLLQKRNVKNDGVYALKGKIKNCRSLSDILPPVKDDDKGDKRKENPILELMNILDLEIGKAQTPTYKRVVIATDADPDGFHITSLLINLFFRWFPDVITRGHLFILSTPLVSVGDGAKRKYFYDLADFEKKYRTTPSGTRYLKGLGSLAVQDWEMVMKDKHLYKITNDKTAQEHIEMAFGQSSKLRKEWLQKEMA